MPKTKMIFDTTLVPHKIDSNKTTKIITGIKENKSNISSEDLKTLAKMVMKNYSDKKLMIKVETNLGFFTIKHYDDSIDNILNDEDYINGRADVNKYQFHKVSFYLI